MKRYFLVNLILMLLFWGIFPLYAQWRHTTEMAGIQFHWNRFTQEGEGTNYYALAIPLRATFSPNRYQSLGIFLNQGYQNFNETGLYGLADLQIQYRYLLSRSIGFLKAEEWTFLAEMYLPTGTTKLEPLKMSVASTARIPYVRAPLLSGTAGFSAKLGAVFAHQLSENVNVGAMGWYFYRGSYQPLKNGGKFNPADEVLLAVSLEMGDAESGIMADFRYGFYTSEKMDRETITRPGNSLATSARVVYFGWEASVLYFNRAESRFEFGGEFKSPSVFVSRIGHRLGSGLVPYLGYEHTGRGERIYPANLFLLGFYSRGINWGGFPVDPFVELRYGTIEGGTRSLGVRVGSSVAFQLYR